MTGSVLTWLTFGASVWLRGVELGFYLGIGGNLNTKVGS